MENWKEPLSPLTSHYVSIVSGIYGKGELCILCSIITISKSKMAPIAPFQTSQLPYARESNFLKKKKKNPKYS